MLRSNKLTNFILTMGNKLLNKIFIILAVLLVIFATIKIYSNYVFQDNAQSIKASENHLEILIYSKEGCIYCINAKNLLDKKQIKYKLIELSNNRDLHLKLASQTGQNTVPYIFINNNFIGGFQKLQALEDNGEL